MLVGFTGLARSGKDTAGLILSRYGWNKYNLATYIKKALLILDPGIIDLTGQVNKLTTLYGIMEPSDVEDPTQRDIATWDKLKEIPEIRRLLQVFGTEVGRDLISKDIWLNLLYEDLILPACVCDIRYDNEAEFIKNFEGSFIIKIENPRITKINNHRSERGINPKLIDFVVENSGNLDDLEVGLFNILEKRYLNAKGCRHRS